jgi:uncharacterized protein with GYD domain
MHNELPTSDNHFDTTRRSLETMPGRICQMNLTATSFQVILILESDEPSEAILLCFGLQPRTGPKYQFSS